MLLREVVVVPGRYNFRAIFQSSQSESIIDMNTITKEMLSEAKACSNQVQLFAEIFPDGARVNKANALKAAKAGLDIDWAVEKFLSESKLDDYLAKIKLIWGDYLVKLKPLVDDFRAKKALLFVEIYNS